MALESLYRRPLPESQIAFSSAEGRALFREALALGTMESYFPLAEQHHTQADPAFCGLGSLVMVLNALSIDPGRLWKGPWRWFSEEMLDCCVSLEAIRTAGLTLRQVGCLARCNGADATVLRAGEWSEAQLRELLLHSSRSATGPFLIAAYSRAVLGQTGLGHYSPLAGYHAGRDRVLLLDVARFKYPSHWVEVPQLFDAMLAVDPVTGMSRGVLQLERAHAPLSLALMFTRQGEGWQQVAAFMANAIPALMQNKNLASAEDALNVVLDGAGEAASGLSLRTSIEQPHREMVDRVLSQLRASAVFPVVARTSRPVAPELAATLLYMIPATAWEGLRPEVRDELHALLDVNALDAELRNDILGLRNQLSELFACRY